MYNTSPKRNKTKQNKIRKENASQKFSLSNLYLKVKVILKTIIYWWREISYSFIKSWTERQNFCHLFSLNAKHCTLSRAEQDLPLHHWQLIIKSNIIFSNRTYASASFKLHFLPVRSISVNQTAFRNPLIAAVFQHSSWNG